MKWIRHDRSLDPSFRLRSELWNLHRRRQRAVWEFVLNWEPDFEEANEGLPEGGLRLEELPCPVLEPADLETAQAPASDVASTLLLLARECLHRQVLEALDARLSACPPIPMGPLSTEQGGAGD